MVRRCIFLFVCLAALSAVSVVAEEIVIVGNAVQPLATPSGSYTEVSSDLKVGTIYFSADDSSVSTANGLQGPAGPTGAAGPAGATGPTGPAGIQGIQGIPGATGSQGVAGPTGPTGATGAQGQIGQPAPSLYYPLLQAQSLDLATVDANLAGFYGGFTDGRYGYFVPNNNGSYSGKVARVDLQNFTAAGVTVLDLATVNAGLTGFFGGFTDGRYGYFVPYNNGSFSGKVARVDLQNFTAGGVTSLDLATVDAGLRGFRGGFTDGRYGYFVPNRAGESGMVARVDLQNFTTGAVTVLDLAAVDAGLKGFSGGFTDGRYGYFVPIYNSAFFGKVARVDLQNFTAGGVTTLDLAAVDASLKGFSGGFTDGRFGYFVPTYNGAYYGKVARVDLQNFTAGGVTTLDLAAVDAGLKGFFGGFTDGRYGYFVPNNNSAYSGKVARIPLFFGGGL